MGKKAIERRERMQRVLEAQEIKNLRRRRGLYDKLLEFDRIPSEPTPILLMMFGEEEDGALWHDSQCHEIGFSGLSDWQRIAIKPPFNTMFIDFGHTRLGDTDGGVLDGYMGAAIDYYEHEEDDDGLSISIYHIDFSIDAPGADGDFDFGYYPSVMDIDEQGFGTNETIVGFGDGINGHMALNALYLVIHALQLLNCRNVELVDYEPDHNVDQSYERHFGKPMTKYKTLRIKSIGKRYESDTQQKAYQGLMPLHLRRGHFAHYSDDAPLFGKYTGTFWRPATVVGEEKRGVVVKDYKVIAPESETS